MMTTTKYNRTNFHKHTFCVFQEEDVTIVGSLQLNYKSKSGSSYFFTDDGVYRLSNHWSRVANCRWRLQENPKLQKTNPNRIKLGFAKWTEFYADNELEKLYFIEVDFDEKTAAFHHKESDSFSEDKMLRTASETAKIIKQIRLLLLEDAWAKYLKPIGIDELRKEIIQQLIQTNQSFNEIRRKFLV
ncbi:hypothetical protein [Flavobacterium sp.]|uniref:hypothetical protein n=1 Tax=Flavobacterium sp. TaxID=239 RepID=UPI002B4B2A93|nr:hypothetical protein [Flavobacterium sp.]HLP64850.1 hypothetical protein [Flavobacterium sp.]